MIEIKTKLDSMATEHEGAGGTCKTIILFGKEIKVCLDENGKPLDEHLEQICKMTNQ
jgi:hypothetical protein